jgi:hypothetical protein
LGGAVGKEELFPPGRVGEKTLVVPAMGRAAIQIMPLSLCSGMDISLISAPSSESFWIAALEEEATLGSVMGSSNPSSQGEREIPSAWRGGTGFASDCICGASSTGTYTMLESIEFIQH